MNNVLKVSNECFAASLRVCLNEGHEAPSVVNQLLQRTRRYPPFLGVLAEQHTLNSLARDIPLLPCMRDPISRESCRRPLCNFSHMSSEVHGACWKSRLQLKDSNHKESYKGTQLGQIKYIINYIE